ncbi:hypothetical protein [Rhizobium sp. CF142]|uniref:hypothetical protein n=1 Tax=Rhizobium sp. CF142 TaxID=1144314 RepID=UPI00026EF42D|nr:hypothetical protein [Rhizobium sp. CF142]EJJ30164.1 hypothetical protein PMI11_01613 [Rhizobium sp. CF142]
MPFDNSRPPSVTCFPKEGINLSDIDRQDVQAITDCQLSVKDAKLLHKYRIEAHNQEMITGGLSIGAVLLAALLLFVFRRAIPRTARRAAVAVMAIAIRAGQSASKTTSDIVADAKRKAQR